VHRDLKPENLLLDYNNNIKIVDFGLSNTWKEGERLKTACGSPWYAAPEMIAGKYYHGTNVDLWSSGIVLYAMVAGFLPFEDPDTSNLYKKILSANDNIDSIIPKFISANCKNLLKKILNTNPRNRYTLDDIKSHPWFNILKPTINEGYLVGKTEFPIDEDIVECLEEYKFDKEELMKAIKENKHNHATTSYYLMLKKVDVWRKNSCKLNPLIFIDKCVRMATNNHKRDMNNSVQYSTKNEDFYKSGKSNAIKTNGVKLYFININLKLVPWTWKSYIS
jgi:5'-AMP-activated protein kinase catalytic alpha subunit